MHESESIRINGPDRDACHACANPVLIFIQCSCAHARNIRRLLPMFDPSGVLDPVGISAKGTSRHMCKLTSLRYPGKVIQPERLPGMAGYDSGFS
jgi:hypothetical protein